MENNKTIQQRREENRVAASKVPLSIEDRKRLQREWSEIDPRNSKHTPGPWTVEDPMEGEWWIVQANLASHEWRTIASIPQGDLEEGFPQEVVQANARLIAAAPQLLEALKALLDITTFSSTDKDCRIHREAEAAIAKAEGR